MSELEPTRSQFLVYQGESGATRIDVRFDGETVWLTQAQLVELFDSSKANISEHIKNVIDDGELDPARTVRDLRTVRRDRTHKDYLLVRCDALAEGQPLHRVSMEMTVWNSKRDGFLSLNRKDVEQFLPGGQP